MDTSADNPELLRKLAPRIYEVVKQVPYGQVTTYGAVAQVVGDGCDARLVGSALNIVKDPQVPWQRVINAKGVISTRGVHDMATQRKRLEEEGLTFDKRGRTNLAHFGWRGPDPEWARQNGFQTLPSQDADAPFQPSLF